MTMLLNPHKQFPLPNVGDEYVSTYTNIFYRVIDIDWKGYILLRSNSAYPNNELLVLRGHWESIGPEKLDTPLMSMEGIGVITHTEEENRLYNEAWDYGYNDGINGRNPNYSISFSHDDDYHRGYKNGYDDGSAKYMDQVLKQLKEKHERN